MDTTQERAQDTGEHAQRDSAEEQKLAGADNMARLGSGGQGEGASHTARRETEHRTG